MAARFGEQLERDTLPLRPSSDACNKPRIAGTAIYMTSRLDMVPVPLLHNLKHNKVLHQRIVLLHVVTAISRACLQNGASSSPISTDNFYTIIAEYGFMQHPNVPRVLHRCVADGLHFDMMETSFFVGRVKIVPAKNSTLGRFRCKVFEVMHRNAHRCDRFLPHPAEPGDRAWQARWRFRNDDAAVIAGLVPATPRTGAQPCHTIGWPGQARP